AKCAAEHTKCVAYVTSPSKRRAYTGGWLGGCETRCMQALARRRAGRNCPHNRLGRKKTAGDLFAGLEEVVYAIATHWRAGPGDAARNRAPSIGDHRKPDCAISEKPDGPRRFRPGYTHPELLLPAKDHRPHGRYRHLEAE